MLIVFKSHLQQQMKPKIQIKQYNTMQYCSNNALIEKSLSDIALGLNGTVQNSLQEFT